MKLKDFWFHLPRNRIARFPAINRDESSLMVVERRTGDISHHIFRDIVSLVTEDDFLVANHSRVIPVRLIGRLNRIPVEVLLVKRLDGNRIEALTRPGKKFRSGVRIMFDEELWAEVRETAPRGRRILEFNLNFEEILKRGYAPLPPYIKRKYGEAREYRGYDLSRYQTVFSRQPGSIAAPTAGLHFTTDLLSRLREKVDVFEINLEVGEATFQKIEVEDIESHRMGSETVTISRRVREKISETRKNKRLIAVGTTTVRALETLALNRPEPETFESELFIYPGFRFRLTDKMITNFHLPESSLFIMVSAFAGLELMQKAYRIAVEKKYRFFSYGDAMMIL